VSTPDEPAKRQKKSEDEDREKTAAWEKGKEDPDTDRGSDSEETK
jgi:hypothetical protein